MKNIVVKSLILTKEKFGDKIPCLFRKEEIFDDIIKYYFFIYGNSLLLNSFIKPLKEMIKSGGQGEISKDQFIIFFGTMIKNTKVYMPSILKMLLKLVNDKVNEIFTIEKGNYAPIMTLLFFNFFLSPRVQDIHNLSPVMYPEIRNINRIIRVRYILIVIYY